MLPVEVKLIDGIVSLEVVVVEHQVVETDTVGQFQTVAEVPFILGIETKLVEGNLSIGVGHTVEAISQKRMIRELRHSGNLPDCYSGNIPYRYAYRRCWQTGAHS